ncbi:MAG: hypothetical protein HS130_11260 [Deltaproteobacteria bacterium]|nr:hypothetical protein [Deltaproteobacteria bacterium]
MGVTDQMADLRSMPDTLPGETVFEWIWTDFLADPGKKYDSKGRKLRRAFHRPGQNINLTGLAMK